LLWSEAEAAGSTGKKKVLGCCGAEGDVCKERGEKVASPCGLKKWIFITSRALKDRMWQNYSV